ncbi:MAG: hypothetical protein O2816_00335 [Planctomycetota bacterium]|nr:hypothetical protein [Planctomycetota bacterium]
MKLALIALVLSSAPGLAQHQIKARKILSAPRDAGVYHVATGTWSRPKSQASLGPDVIYRADAPSGYFGVGWQGDWAMDEGTMPGPTHPRGGSQESYVIDGFAFSYCTLGASVKWKFFFLDSYVSCAGPQDCSSVASPVYSLNAPGAGACWTVTLDLSGGQEFCLEADGGSCNPGYQGVGGGRDHFGIAHEFSTTMGQATGPILAGFDPDWAPAGQGTCYDAALTCASGASGLGGLDQFEVAEGGIGPGCYSFGGYLASFSGCGGPSRIPGAQFAATLFTDCADSICADPCGDRYCLSGPDQVGVLTIDTCDLASGSATITATQTQSVRTAYLCVSANNGVITDPPGAVGDLCLAGVGPIGRYVRDLRFPNGSGTWSIDLISDATGAGVGALPDPPGGVLAFGETWHFQGWGRVPGGSRFTTALEVTFH